MVEQPNRKRLNGGPGDAPPAHHGSSHPLFGGIDGHEAPQGHGKRIVIVGQRSPAAGSLADLLERAGHPVVRADTAATGLAAVLVAETSAVLVDARLSMAEQERLRVELRDRRYPGPVLVVSEHHKPPDPRDVDRAAAEVPPER